MQSLTNQIVVAIFPSQVILTKALDKIEQLNDDPNVVRAAVVTRDTDGRLVVLDDTIGAEEGALAGGTVGAVVGALGLVTLGALTLPVGGAAAAVGAGALVGGLIGRFTGRLAADLIDFGFPKEDLSSLLDQLEDGHPALVLAVRDAGSLLPYLEETLQSYRAQFVTATA